MPAARTIVRHSSRAISELAERVRALDSFRTTEGEVRDRLNALVVSWRGSIVVATPEQSWESLRVEDDKSFTIFLSPETSPLRDNFTIGHELGHLLLHTDFDAPGVAHFNRFGSDRAETEANWFAASLLMPRDEFTASARENGPDPYLLAGRFGVSVAAANVRLRALRLIQ